MAVKLNENVKALWLARLRSGTEGQCKGQLGDGQGNFCCLGVLSEIAVEQGVIPAPTLVTVNQGMEDEYTRLEYETTYATLPSGTHTWAFDGEGTDDYERDNPSVKVSDDDGYVSTTSLAELNDRGKTFAEIADIIEEQL